MMAFDNTGTWSLVELIVGKKVIDCKWMLAVMVNSNDLVACLKSSFKGFDQSYSVDVLF